MEWLHQLWNSIADNLRWADLLDLGLIAIFIYFILRWLSARTSRGILVGVLLIGFCYILSAWLDLYLTRRLFQAGFIFLLLSIVVVLQQDIRRGFEKLAALRMRHNREPDEAGSDIIADVVMTVSQMSEEKIGALLVFPGREPVDRFTHGGIRVDACLSPTLLHSIFRPESPGHDGAVTIRNNRVDQLGIHLPLSTDVAALGSGGTRHAAALGLAERCDALVVVVSEERGSISFAQHGQLHTVSVEELEPLLVRHQTKPASQSMRSLARRTFARRLPLKFASLAIAFVLWTMFAFRVDSIQRNYVVPIEFRNVPNNLVVSDPSATRAQLVLSGAERVLDEVDSNAPVVTFDLSDTEEGQTLRLQTRKGLQHLPKSLDVVEIFPEQIEVDVVANGNSSGVP